MSGVPPLSAEMGTDERGLVRKHPGAGERAAVKCQRERHPELMTAPEYSCFLLPAAKVENVIFHRAFERIPGRVSAGKK